MPARPGDHILDHYLPNASAEEREAARESLCRFARLLIRVHERLARERTAVDNPIRANVDAELESESANFSV